MPILCACGSTRVCMYVSALTRSRVKVDVIKNKFHSFLIPQWLKSLCQSSGVNFEGSREELSEKSPGTP